MRIARARWTAYRIPFRLPYVSGAGRATHREGLLLELTSSDGHIGLGEAALVPESDDFASLEPAMRTLAAGLSGRTIDASYRNAGAGATDAERAVACAIETAFYDLQAQNEGVSLAQLLAPDCSPVAEVRVNALISAPSIEAAANAASNAVADGFTAVKLKVGMTSDLEAERERVAAVRNAIGPGVRLRLDPNGAWPAEQAIATIRILESYDIEYVEQPVAPGDLQALRLVQSSVAIPIAADEDLISYEAALRILETDAARVLILKPQRLGGLRTCRHVIKAATAAGVRCVVTTSIETGVGTAACLHLAATLQADSPAAGLATASLLESDLTTLPIRVVRGVMRLPDVAGLGVELDQEALTRYTDGWRAAP